MEVRTFIGFVSIFQLFQGFRKISTKGSLELVRTGIRKETRAVCSFDSSERKLGPPSRIVPVSLVTS